MMRFLRPASLWLAMYLTTFVIVSLETGYLLTGAKIAVLTASIKSLVALAHHRLWDRLDRGRPLAGKAGPGCAAD